VKLDHEHEPRVDSERICPCELLNGDRRCQRVELLRVLIAVAETRRSPRSAPAAPLDWLSDASQPEQPEIRLGRP
jgi:hypothetical protein